MINSFSGPYEFLSNFYNCPVTAWGITYRSSEAAFQAQKTKDEELKKGFSILGPSQAKLKGRTIELRKDWERIKDSVMYHVLRYKFYQNKTLYAKLMRTEDEELIEGNWWHDNYWGDCYCDKCKDIKGQNNLGKMLMDLREEFRNSKSQNLEKIYDFQWKQEFTNQKSQDLAWGGTIE